MRRIDSHIDYLKEETTVANESTHGYDCGGRVVANLGAVDGVGKTEAGCGGGFRGQAGRVTEAGVCFY